MYKTFILLITLTISTYAVATENSFEFSSQISWIHDISNAVPLNSVVNPDNKLLEVPKIRFSSELRPDLKLTYNNMFTGIARPRFLLFNQTVDKNKTDGKIWWNEVYGQINASDRIQIAYGKMNFQWGPAELLPPSNRIFQNVEMQPSPLFQFEGKHLLRINATYEKNLSAILLAQVQSTTNTFDTLVIKPEYSWNSGGDYFGLVLGASKIQKTWVGEYFAINPTDSLQFYLDGSHSQGSERYFPEQNAFGLWQLKQSSIANTNIESRAASGLRYTCQRGDELRIEYYYQSDGYGKSEFQKLNSSLDSNQVLRTINLVSFYQNPSGLQGKHYSYLAFRIPDLGHQKKLQLTPRYLHSWQDNSGSLFLTSEYNLTNAAVLVAVFTYSRGNIGQDLTLKARASGNLALQYSF